MCFRRLKKAKATNRPISTGSSKLPETAANSKDPTKTCCSRRSPISRLGCPVNSGRPCDQLAIFRVRQHTRCAGENRGSIPLEGTNDFNNLMLDPPRLGNYRKTKPLTPSRRDGLWALPVACVAIATWQRHQAGPQVHTVPQGANAAAVPVRSRVYLAAAQFPAVRNIATISPSRLRR